MIILIFSFALASCLGFCVGALAQPAQQNQCFSTAETRDKIAAHGLSEPLRSIEKAAAHFQAEALGAKLCRRNDAFVYEISLLRRDGKIVHGVYDAKTGQIVEPKPAKERED
ncbi:MAG: PepSY domain-containing protein [Methylocella sp.]